MFNRQYPGLTIVDLLGLTMAFSVALCLASPDSAPAPLRDILLADSSRLASRTQDQADCLWLAARNHGFYDIQQDAIEESSAGSPRSALWMQFLNSTGHRECGTSMATVSDLTQALSASLAQADGHFKVLENSHNSLRDTFELVQR